MTAPRRRIYPKGKGEGRIAETAAVYRGRTATRSDLPEPIRLGTSVLKSMGKPIRIVKLTREEISAKAAALREKLNGKPGAQRSHKKAAGQPGGAAKATKTGTGSVRRSRKR